MSAGHYEVRRVHGSGKYAVFNAAGERVSSPANHDVALTVAQNLAKGQGRKLRPCLTCGDEFVSHGIGNRICGRCKSHRDLSDAGLPYALGRR